MSIELYKQEIEKQAGIESLVKGAIPAITKGVEGFAGKSLARRALTGAAVGAGIKGLTYQAPQGQPSTAGGRIGAMASGALTGGLAGGMLSKGNLASVKGMFGKGTAASAGAVKGLAGAGAGAGAGSAAPALSQAAINIPSGQVFGSMGEAMNHMRG